MKLTCSQSDLARILSIVNRAVNPNNTLPVLNNILLKAEGKKLYLSATNLDIAINAAIDANVENEGMLTVPAKAFTGYVSLLSDDSVALAVENGTTLDIRSTGSDTKMKGISGEEFPLLPKLKDPVQFELPGPEMKEGIELVAFAASTNISRPALTGIFMQMAGKLVKLAATDSYRLAEKRIELEKDLGVEQSFIIPARTAQELAKIIGSTEAATVKVQVAKGQIRFEVDGVEVTSRLIEQNFPDYEKILPKESKTSAKLLTEDFVLALKKMSVIVRENNNNVRVKAGANSVAIVSDETQLGQGNVELMAETEGEALEASLNAQYLLDVLTHLGEKEVNFSLNDGLSPVKVVPAQANGYLHIIMPLKV